MAYCTRAQVLEYLQDLDDATDGPLIDKIIVRVQAAIDRITMRSFDSTAGVVEIFDGSGLSNLFCKRDIAAVTQLRVRDAMPTAWRIVPLADVLLEPNNRRAEWPALWLSLPTYPTGADGRFPRGSRTVELTYTRGWPAVPKDIEEAALELTVRTWKARASGFSDVVGVEGIESLITTKALPALGREFLLHLKRDSVVV